MKSVKFTLNAYERTPPTAFARQLRAIFAFALIRAKNKPVKSTERASNRLVFYRTTLDPILRFPSCIALWVVLSNFPTMSCLIVAQVK